MQTITIDQLKEAIGEVLDQKGFTTLLDDVSSLKGKVDELEIKFDKLSASVTQTLDMLKGISVNVNSLDSISNWNRDNVTVLNQNFDNTDLKIEKFEERISILENKIEQIEKKEINENQQKTE